MQRWEYLTILVGRGGWIDSTGRSGELPKMGVSQAGDPTRFLNELGEQG